MIFFSFNYSTFIMSSAEKASVRREFQIFAHRPIQNSEVGTDETMYKPIAQ